MEVEKAIFERRSVRSFTDKDIEPEILEKLCKSAIWSPTGGNAQPWVFISVAKKETVKLIKTFSPGLLGNPKALIAVLSDKKTNVERMGPLGEVLAVMDCSMAAQNIMLQAYSLGLGSCAIRSFNQEAVREILKAPVHLKPELLVILGYPEKSPPAPPRREETIHREFYGTPGSGGGKDG